MCEGGRASKDKCNPALIPCTKRGLSSSYNYLAQQNQNGAARHYPEQTSTASPFVATFLAANLLVFFLPSINRKTKLIKVCEKKYSLPKKI